MPETKESIRRNISRNSLDLAAALRALPGGRIEPPTPPPPDPGSPARAPLGHAEARGPVGVAVGPPQYYGVRVGLLGFRCEVETWDHAFEVDGPRDEIVVQTTVQEFDRDKKAIEQKSVQTAIYGKASMEPAERIQAGTATPEGGIRSGDSVPDDIRRVALVRNYPAHRLPLLLWAHEGVVGEQLDGYLVITPSLIEWDGGVDFLTQYGQGIGNFLAGLGKVVAAAAGVGAILFPPVAGVLAGVGAAAAGAGQAAPGLIGELQKFLGSAGDRPIGQKVVDGKRTFDPQILSFNLATIRDIADADPLGLGRGVWGVSYEDDASLGGGKYGVYVHVAHYVHPVLQ
jgi:hypothetical protein